MLGAGQVDQCLQSLVCRLEQVELVPVVDRQVPRQTVARDMEASGALAFLGRLVLEAGQVVVLVHRLVPLHFQIGRLVLPLVICLDPPLDPLTNLPVSQPGLPPGHPVVTF